MSLGAFMYGALGLAEEEGVRFHVETDTVPRMAAPAPSKQQVRNQNAQAMAALTGLMSGVQKRK